MNHTINEHIQKYQLPLKYDNGPLYEFALVCRDGKYFLTDQGNTFEQLDKVFELKEPDVIKNLVAILKHFKVNKINDEFLIEITDWDNDTNSEVSKGLAEAKYRLFACISFMERMKIFYV